MVGTNTEETRLFLLSDGAIDRITEEAVSAIAGAYGLPVEGLSAYRAAHPGASAGELFSAIQTDWYWRIPAVRLADAHAATARASTYMSSSPGARRSSGAASGLLMAWRSLSSSIRWASEPSRYSGETRRDRSRT